MLLVGSNDGVCEDFTLMVLLLSLPSSVMVFVVGIMGGNRNVPHVMHTKSDQCGGIVLTISPGLTFFAFLLFDFFGVFFF